MTSLGKTFTPASTDSGDILSFRSPRSRLLRFQLAIPNLIICTLSYLVANHFGNMAIPPCDKCPALPWSHPLVQTAVWGIGALLSLPTYFLVKFVRRRKKIKMEKQEKRLLWWWMAPTIPLFTSVYMYHLSYTHLRVPAACLLRNSLYVFLYILRLSILRGFPKVRELMGLLIILIALFGNIWMINSFARSKTPFRGLLFVLGGSFAEALYLLIEGKVLRKQFVHPLLCVTIENLGLVYATLSIMPAMQEAKLVNIKAALYQARVNATLRLLIPVYALCSWILTTTDAYLQRYDPQTHSIFFAMRPLLLEVFDSLVNHKPFHISFYFTGFLFFVGHVFFAFAFQKWLPNVLEQRPSTRMSTAKSLDFARFHPRGGLIQAATARLPSWLPKPAKGRWPQRASYHDDEEAPKSPPFLTPHEVLPPSRHGPTTDLQDAVVSVDSGENPCYRKRLQSSKYNCRIPLRRPSSAITDRSSILHFGGNHSLITRQRDGSSSVTSRHKHSGVNARNSLIASDEYRTRSMGIADTASGRIAYSQSLEEEYLLTQCDLSLDENSHSVAPRQIYSDYETEFSHNTPGRSTFSQGFAFSYNSE